MRSKELVPVGQGCKRVKGMNYLHISTPVGRCKCHPEYYLNICPCCGDFFHTRASHTVTCSDRCRKRRSRSKNDKFFQTVMAFANGVQS